MTISQFRMRVMCAARVALARPQFEPDPARDVFLVSYPRSGNTWLRAVIAHILCGEAPRSLRELDYVVPDIHYAVPINLVRKMPGYVVKSHESLRDWSASSKYKRVIYLVRDPRDAILSFHGYVKNTSGYEGKIDEFAKDVCAGRIFPCSWQEHVESWTYPSTQTADLDMLVLRYEDLNASPRKHFRQIADFLRVEASESFIAHVVALSSADEMRKRELVGNRPTIHSSAPFFIGDARPGQWIGQVEQAIADMIASFAGRTMARFGYK